MSALPTDAGHDWGGVPLASTLRFLLIPAGVLIALRAVSVDVPVPVLYAIAVLMGVALVVHTFKDPEWLLGAATLYLPLDRMYVIPIAPGINGTNVVLALLVFAWWRESRRRGEPMLSHRPGTTLVGWWAGLSVLSVVTAMIVVGPFHILEDNIDRVKGWIDQFIVFYAVVHLIRDGKMARRMVVYLMLGLLIGTLLGFQEWFDKRDYDSIDKARLLGPQLQPNDFGAFFVYAMGPLVGLFAMYIRDVRVWIVCVPWFSVIARVMLATFSRGAFIGAGVLAITILFVRGRAWFAGAVLAVFAVVNFAPEWLPNSFTERMSQTEDDGRLDTSSQTRLILWKAALKITAEYPVFGTGFATFPRLKDDYTEQPVPEADNHNMFLYIASQMGVPALIVFVLMLLRWLGLSAAVYRRATDRFAQGIGLGCVGLVAGTFGVCMFGSRMVDLNVMAYVWLHFAVISNLWREVHAAPVAAQERV